MEDIDKEELINIAKDGEESKPVRTKQPNRFVLKFIKDNGIKAGKTKVPMYLLYYHFKQTPRIAWENKVSNIEFGRNFSLFFDSFTNGRCRYYLLDVPFDMSKPALKKARTQYQRYLTYRKKKLDERKEKKKRRLEEKQSEEPKLKSGDEHQSS